MKLIILAAIVGILAGCTSPVNSLIEYPCVDGYRYSITPSKMEIVTDGNDLRKC